MLINSSVEHHIHMQAALDHLQEQSVNIREEDEARLSPLVHGHFNVFGHYSFILTEQIMKGSSEVDPGDWTLEG
jgi:hypothetical protein